MIEDLKSDYQPAYKTAFINLRKGKRMKIISIINQKGGSGKTTKQFHFCKILM